jgi:cytochrome c553
MDERRGGAGERRGAARRARHRWLLIAAGALAALWAGTPAARADDFEAKLARVDRALQENPSRVSENALDSCRNRRNFAVQLHDAGFAVRAERSLDFCLDVLELHEAAPAPATAKAAPPSMEEVRARAARELEKALALTPNLEHGLQIYRDCAMCHGPEGWGLGNGSVPQLAGQHRTVIIKQLADIRAGNRDDWMMLPYASVEAIGGTQAVADVAGYIDTLEISVENGKGSGKDLELGERLYRDNCVRCHGAKGEGNADTFVPRIQSQHYDYLVRQFESIRDGKRRNANPEMVAQIGGFGPRETHAVLDYVSRLQPPEALQAPPGWHNPDFGAGWPR